MSRVQSTPPARGLSVRRLRFAPEKINRQYVRGLPVIAHWLTALSTTFPMGEQFFVHSVRQVRDRITDPELQAQISAFIGQEAMHSEAHQRFNARWQQADYRLPVIEQWLRRGNRHARGLHPKVQLAITCAFEHFTALLGEYILRHPELVDRFEPEAAHLWLWHALEEAEHKSVAFDVYQQLYGDDPLRRKLMRTCSLAFAYLSVQGTASLLWQDRHHALSHPLQVLNSLAQLARLWVTVLPEYLDYYRADFHPAQRDRSTLLDHWRQKLAAQPDTYTVLRAAA